MRKASIGSLLVVAAVAMSAPASAGAADSGITASKGCKKNLNVSHHRGRCGNKHNGRHRISH